MNPLLRWALIFGAIALIVFAVVAGYERWRDGVRAEGDAAGAARVKAQWDADVRKRDTAKLAAVAKAREEEQAAAAAVVKGESDARQKAEARAALDRAAADRARRAGGGLRDDIAALDGAARAVGVPDAATCPGRFAEQRDAAMRARKLLDTCGTRYLELAQRIDESWAGITLKLDTAIGYINAVAPR